MSTPRSVVKFNRDGVTYTSSVDHAKYTIIELTRAAMRDVGKFIVRKCNTEAMKLPGLKKSRRVRGRSSAFLYDVPFAKTGLPHVDIGITDNTWYGVLQELGTSKQPKRSILRNTVFNNIDTIIEIESKYLTAVGTDRAESLISEEQYSGGADDE